MRLRRDGLALCAWLVSIPAAVAAPPEKLWELGGLKTPESAVFDPATKVLYVSNIDGEVLAKDGNGFISKVSPDGRILEDKWVTGLNAPKGLALSGAKLYVADIDELVVVDVTKGAVVNRLPAPGAIFLNDVAAGAGRVYVSDTATNAIWALNGEKLTTFASDPRLKSPNGLLVQGDKLVVAAIGVLPQGDKAGVPANLIEVSLADASIRDLGDGRPVGYLDGLEPLGDESYLVTDWGQGGLFRIEATGAFEKLLPFAQGSADLAYVPDTKTAYIPLMMENKLVAYKVE